MADACWPSSSAILRLAPHFGIRGLSMKQFKGEGIVMTACPLLIFLFVLRIKGVAPLNRRNHKCRRQTPYPSLLAGLITYALRRRRGRHHCSLMFDDWRMT